MKREKSPPINLDKYIVKKEHRYCTYQDGARLYSMNYWSFVGLCKEAGANIFVVGSAIFGKPDPEAVCREFVNLVESK